MKSIFFYVALAFIGKVNAANYYFSSSTGDDSRTAVQAQNTATPWKTLSKLNAFFSNLQPGDSVLFKRGDTFYGSITVGKSGEPNKPIVLTAYGTGEKPVISGFTTLTSWTSLGGGVYQSSCPSCKPTVNMLTINDKPQMIGRYPNSSYLTYENFSGTTSITDNELTSTPNWTGAEVVIRKNRWVIDRNKINAHTGNTISYTSPSSYPATDGYGYFIQNDPRTLDTLGEWYFKPTDKKMHVYFGNNMPSAYKTQTSTIDTLVYIRYFNYLTFDKLSFEGANVTAFQIAGAAHVSISNCTVYFSGADAFVAESSQYLKIEDNNINHCLNDGVFLDMFSTNAVIKKNTIKKIGLMPGMGKSGTGTYEGINSFGGKSQIELNVIDSTGYNGIYFGGNESEVKNNFINFFCLTKDDGAGIYVGDRNIPYRKRITNNIILNGKGNSKGTDNLMDAQAEGIYIDDYATNVEVYDNTVAYCANSGIKIHNAHGIKVANNTVFNNGSQISMEHDNIASDSPIRNVTIKNNVFFSKLTLQSVFRFSTIANDINDFGTSDSNYYARPLDSKNILATSYLKDGKNLSDVYDLPGWKSTYNRDKQSRSSPVAISEYQLNTIKSTNKLSNGFFNNNINGCYCWNPSGSCIASWDNSRNMNGGSLKVSYKWNTSEKTIVVFPIGSINPAKTYILKYTVMGSKPASSMEIFLRQSLSPYNNLSVIKNTSATTTKTNYQILFTPTLAESDASIIFQVNASDGTFWLDNIEFYEADVTMTNPDDYIRFEYNASTTDKVVALDGVYMGVDSTLYSNTVTLAPYSSIVLLKDPSFRTLPLQFLRFEGGKVGKEINLMWQTANESHTGYFDVLRSSDGTHFEAIGRKTATNKSSLSTYTLTDNKPFSGKNYYQLKQVDKDGKYTYSKIIIIFYSDALPMQLSPNPAINQLTVSLSTAQHTPNATLQIRSLAGNMVRQIPVNSFFESIPVDVSTLSKGTYIVSLLYNGTTLNQKFIKQ